MGIEINKKKILKNARVKTKEYFKVILSKSNLGMLVAMVALPILFPLILSLVCDEGMYVYSFTTQQGCLMIAFLAVLIGVIDSNQEICKERALIKREYMTDMPLSSYTLSKFFVQMIICLIQSILYVVMLFVVFDVPATSVTFMGSAIEIFLTVFLIMYAANATGLACSALAKDGVMASYLFSVVLAFQLMFSKIIFELEGFWDKLSYISLTRLGVEALASISDVNNMNYSAKSEFPYAMDMFESTAGHIVKIWLGLIVMIVALWALSTLLLRRVKNDKR